MSRLPLVCNTGPLIALSVLELHKAKRIDQIHRYLEQLFHMGYWLSKDVVDWALAQCQTS
jgi:hypothetical protein